MLELYASFGGVKFEYGDAEFWFYNNESTPKVGINADLLNFQNLVNLISSQKIRFTKSLRFSKSSPLSTSRRKLNNIRGGKWHIQIRQDCTQMTQINIDFLSRSCSLFKW